METTLSLWGAVMPGPSLAVGPERDQTKPGDGLVAGRRVIRLTDIATPSVQVFAPPPRRRNGTAVVVCPGGGFQVLAWDLEGTEVAAWLNGLGITAIVLKHRVPTGNLKPPHAGPVMDAQRALRLVRSRAAEWQLAPDRIGILGFSAGGRTAGLAALQNGRALYGPTDDTDRASCRPDFAALIYPAYFIDERGQLLADVAPLIDKSVPPTFFAHAADDPITCQSSVQLFGALQRAGVPSELHIWESGGHGYGLRPQRDKPVTTWPQRCEAWLRGRGALRK